MGDEGVGPAEPVTPLRNAHRVQIVSDVSQNPLRQPPLVSPRTGEQATVSTMGQAGFERRKESCCFSWLPLSLVRFTTYVLWLKMDEEEYPVQKRVTP